SSSLELRTSHLPPHTTTLLFLTLENVELPIRREQSDSLCETTDLQRSRLAPLESYRPLRAPPLLRLCSGRHNRLPFGPLRYHRPAWRKIRRLSAFLNR